MPTDARPVLHDTRRPSGSRQKQYEQRADEDYDADPEQATLHTRANVAVPGVGCGVRLASGLCQTLHMPTIEVTVVAHEVGTRGGMEAQLGILAQGLLEAGVHVTVISRRCELPPHPLLTVHRIRIPGSTA
jgi:hypothetical protein